jgi:hypothetical protein
MSTFAPSSGETGRTTRVRGLAPWPPQYARQHLETERTMLVEWHLSGPARTQLVQLRNASALVAGHHRELIQQTVVKLRDADIELDVISAGRRAATRGS